MGDGMEDGLGEVNTVGDQLEVGWGFVGKGSVGIDPRCYEKFDAAL